MKRFVQTKAGVFEPVNPNCTCYDRANGKCVPQQVCTSCNAFPDSPNCNYRVGNTIIPRYQTQVGGNIYATPTNRFRNAVELMPLGTASGGFGMPIGNSGNDAYLNANGNTPIDLGGGQFTPISPAILGGIQITSPRNLSQVQLRKISYNVLASKFGRGFADKNTISIYGKAISPATGFSVYSISVNGVAQNPLFATDKAASFFQNFGIVVDGLKTPLSVYFNFGRVTQPKQSPLFSPNPKGGKGFQNAVGLPAKGGFNPSPYNPSAPVSGRVNGKKCSNACAKTGLMGVFIDGKCYCTTPRLYGEWHEKNFNNAQGGCDWLFCQSGYTKRACRCVENEDLPKWLKKKKGLNFSNFFSNPFSTPKTAMSDARCKRICGRSEHQAILVNGICTCASVNDIADFQKDKGFHNAVSGKRRCEEQVNCPNGWSPKVVGLNCQCVKNEAVVSPSSIYRGINRI